jgi:hypothetical protein
MLVLRPQRYTFLVGIPEEGLHRVDAAAKQEAARTLAAAIRDSGKLRLDIWRNEEVLVSTTVAVPSGFVEEALNLTATAEGGLLTFQVNALPSLTFQDAFPLRSGTGVFGLSWHGEAQLRRLHAESKLPSAEPGALERGDRLYLQRRWREALACYETLPDSQEAVFKAALCLLAENPRDDRAGERLKRLAVEEGNHWSAMAEVHLWLLRLRQKRLAEATALLKIVAARSRFKDLVPLIPQRVRQEIVDEYNRQRIVEFTFKPRDPDAEERLLEVQTLFRAPEAIIQRTRLALVRALHEAGRVAEAIKHSRELLGQPLSPALRRLLLWDYAWLCIRANDPATGLAEVERWRAYSETKQDGLAVHLLPHQAVLRARLKRYNEAEEALREYRRRISLESQSADASLLYGFLLERRNDPAGAKDVWRRAYRALMKTSWARRDMTTVVLGSLANEVNEKDVADIIQALMVRSLDYFPLMNSVSSGVLAPADLAPVLRAMWQSERGRRYAQKLAFLEMTYAEWNSVPVRLFGYEVCNQAAMGGKPSSQQDKFLWDLACEVHGRYAAGKLDNMHLLQMWMAWKLSIDYAVAAVLKTRFDASLRAAGFYLNGLHLLRKDSAYRVSAILGGSVVSNASTHVLPSIVTSSVAMHRMESYERGQSSSVKSASQFFSQAVKLAKEGSLLQQLARAELKRLKQR